jgi:hypothetical protein
VSSNVSQSYPYRSETEAERASTVTGLAAKREGLLEKLASESSPLDGHDRWWVWKCPSKGCSGFLHVAGYARERHGLYVVCDGTCARTFLR